MIVDRIDNLQRYQGFGKRLYDALCYVRSTDFSQLAVGEHQVDGRDVFVIVNDYALKPASEGRLEAHRKYVDIQYLAQGSEEIGYAPLGAQEIVVDYDPAGDYALYEGSSSLVRLKQGMFAIFFPEDLHMPGVGDPGRRVRKVVVKVRLED